MSGKFNLADYETVKARKTRFYGDHPDGRIIVDFQAGAGVAISDGALMRAVIYLTGEDQSAGLAKSTGYAFEERIRTKAISRSGREYEEVNYSSWTENAEESAVGRALDNAGYASNGRPSREEMEKATRMNAAVSTPTPQPARPQASPNNTATPAQPRRSYNGNNNEPRYNTNGDRLITRKQWGLLAGKCKEFQITDTEEKQILSTFGFQDRGQCTMDRMNDLLNAIIEYGSAKIKPVTVDEAPF